jgi:predicted nucleic acid-binding protein
MNAVDTNVLVYACDQRQPLFQERALQLVYGLSDGIMPWQVACEFIAASRKLADQGLTPAMAWQRLDEFLELLPLHVPSNEVLESARLLHVEQQWSYWDALLVAACREAGVTRLYTEDLPGRTPPDGLEIVNPFA